MSQTRSGLLINLRATPLAAVNSVLRQNFSPSLLAQSLDLRLAANFVAAFITIAGIVHSRITQNRRNRSESQTLLLWNVSCILTAVLLSLTCWLLYTIAPGIQLISELVASVLYDVGFVFSFLVGTVTCYVLVVVIVAIAIAFSCLPNVSLEKIWLFTGGTTAATVLITVTGGKLIDCLTTVVCLFTVFAGDLLTVCVRLAAILLVVGVAVLSVLNAIATKQSWRASNRLDTSYGSLLIDNPNDTVIHRQRDRHRANNRNLPRFNGEDVAVNRRQRNRPDANDQNLQRFRGPDVTVVRRPRNYVCLKKFYQYTAVNTVMYTCSCIKIGIPTHSVLCSGPKTFSSL